MKHQQNVRAEEVYK